MDYLTKGSRLLNKFLVIAYILLLSFNTNACCLSKQHSNMNDSTLFEIDFQDFFINDTVSLRINNCAIFNNVRLLSNGSLGLTKMRVKVSRNKGSDCQVKFLNKAIKCRIANDEIKLTILLNGAENKYTININDGKYIGFSKKDGGELYFNQSKIPFQYD